MSTTETTAPFDYKTFADKKPSMLDIATVLQNPDLKDEDKYKLSKLMLEVTKVQFIDPMKEYREKEKEEAQKEAEQRAAAVSEFRTKLNVIISDQLLEDVAELAADYIEAGHGNVISIEIMAKKDAESGEVKAEFSSNVAKPRAKKGTTTRTRETGSTGAGVTVQGSPKEGVVGPTLATATQYPSFTAAARELGFVNDETNMKGLNCKRLLESKGYTCEYIEATEAPAPAPAVDTKTTETVQA